jgi:ankyrin repeat protein
MPYVQKTVFHLAAKLSLIDVLKEADEKDLNTRDEDGRTPIHYASLKGHLTALKLILVRG